MHLRVSRLWPALVVGLTFALLAAFAVPAFAAPAAQRLLATRPFVAGMHSQTTGGFLLPAGSKLSGNLKGQDELDFFAAVHKGQPVSVTVTTRRGWSDRCFWGVFDALKSDGDPAIDFRLMKGATSTTISFTAPYDTVIVFAVYAPDASHGTFDMSWQIGDPPVQSSVLRRYGSNRFATAIAVSQNTFAAGSADTAIVATGRNFADALAASGLAGSYDCPILLTEPGTLSPGVDAEITRLGATQVLVMGSDKAVADSVVTALTHDGRTVRRVAGTTRWATAAAIADEIRAHETSAGRTPSTECFVVNGLNYPDALAASPAAFAKKMPILLTLPGGTDADPKIPPATSSELTSMSATHAYVVGGASVVSNASMNALGVVAERISGPEGSGRMETAMAFADAAVSHNWSSWSHVGLATGWDYPDALAGGAALGHNGGILLLGHAMYVDETLYDKVLDNRASISDVALFGGPSVVAGSVRGHMDHALRGDAFGDDEFGFGITYGAN